jgi:hypothetical protein
MYRCFTLYTLSLLTLLSLESVEQKIVPPGLKDTWFYDTQKTFIAMVFR